MKKRRSVLWAGFIAATLMILLPAISCMAASITLKLGHTGAPKSIYDVVSYKLAERVAANTNGEVEIKVFGHSQFGDIPQHWGQLKSGAIDIFMSEPVLALIPEPPPKNFMVIITPYLFENQAHYRKYIGSELFASMMRKVEDAGNMKFFGYLGDRPPRALTTTNRKVTSPDDLKGLKIRTATLPPAIETWKAWGANPTPLPPSEMYAGLKSGLIEGQENDITYVRDAKFYEVQEYFIAIDYIRSGHGGWMNRNKWDSLSEDVKKAFFKSSEETAEYVNQYALDQVPLAEKFLQEHGMVIIHPDLAPFKELARQWAEKNDGKHWEKGLYDRIRALK